MNKAKVLKDMADKLISADTNPWQFDAKFMDNFTGNKRIRKKQAKKFIKWAVENVVLPYVRETTNANDSQHT